MSYLDQIDSLSNFKNEVLQPGVSFDEMNFDEGYRELYHQWSEVVGEDALLTMNPDDRLISFTDFVRDDNLRVAEAQVRRTLNPSKRAALAKEVTRGQYLRVQDENGDFNKIIPRSDLDSMDALTTRAISDTCVSTTTNWEEVCDQQSALSFAHKLREQHFLVKSITVGREFKAEVIHPKTGPCTVAVDLNQSLAEALVFEFVNGDGKKKSVSMNQFGDAYGMIQDSFLGNIEDLTSIGKKVISESIVLNGADKNSAALAAQAAFGAAYAMGHFKNKKRAQLAAGEMPMTDLPNGAQVPNMEVARSNVVARQEQQRAINEESEKGRKEAHQRYKESARDAATYHSEQKALMESRRASDKKRNKSFMAGAIGGLLGSGTATAIMTWIAM